MADSDLSLCFFAKANATNTRLMDIAIERVSNEITNVIGTATLTTNMQEFAVALPKWKDGDSIRFNSLTNGDRRVIIGSVAIVSGYSEGQEVPSYIINGQDVGEATFCQFEGLPSVPVFFAVEAYGKRGVASPTSEAVEVDLSNPDKVAVLNACPISSLAGSTYTQNFDSLAELTATTGDKDWLNGTTLQYWQAYNNRDVVTKFKWNGGGEATSGLYALSPGSSPSGSSRALGVNSTKGNEFSFGLSFTNDTDRTMQLSSVEYLPQQWGFGNTTNQTLSLSAKVVDSLNWISAYNDGWTLISSAQSIKYESSESHVPPLALTVVPADTGVISIAPGQVLMIKWTVHSLKGGTSGVMAIDGVEAKFESVKNAGFSIRLASKSTRP